MEYVHHPLLGARVLVVDDDEDFVSFLSGQFSAIGCECVDTAGSGLEALERIADQGAYDLVVTDVRMPAPSGVQLVAMARTAEYAVPFLVVTAFPEPDVFRTVGR